MKGDFLRNHQLVPTMICGLWTMTQTLLRRSPSLSATLYSSTFYHQGGFLDCKCNWGLFRDRNVTLRKSKKIHHGMDDLAKKGWIEEFDGKKTLDWWVPGSKCDEVGGQDASTLPPLWTRDMTYDFYTPLMCRRWIKKLSIIITFTY